MTDSVTSINPTNRKKPQDRKPKAAPVDNDAARVPFSELPGHEFFVPFDNVDVEDQLNLSQKLVDLGLMAGTDEAEGAAVDPKAINFGDFASLVAYLRQTFIADAEGFAKFARGRGAMHRVLPLAVAYAAELGADEDRGNE